MDHGRVDPVRAAKNLSSAAAQGGGTLGSGGASDGGARGGVAQGGQPEDPWAEQWRRVQAKLRASVGEDLFNSWFGRLELDGVVDGAAHLSVPTVFLSNWIRNHYAEVLVECCRAGLGEVETVQLSVRRPGNFARPGLAQDAASDPDRSLERGRHVGDGAPSGALAQTTSGQGAPTIAGGFEGSPLDPKLSFDSFVVGGPNRLAHASALQTAESVFERPLRYNPLYLHGGVGLGKTHLLHAIAWHAKARNPNAQILYLTAERFRYRFVEALRSKDALSFTERLRNIDLLLVDDMQFMQGQRTELEFEHTLNSLIDGGKQVVVASAYAPHELENLDARMRSRLSGGLVAEISPLDYALRLDVLRQRLEEKRKIDADFDLSEEVLDFLAKNLTESGRELEGAIIRLSAQHGISNGPITVEAASVALRDLLRGSEPRRIKIDDILRVISKHYGVNRVDLLSQRRHRSVVWPRQIGMFLAKKMTSRSLPEIGKRFGGRDHTTVLHAVRKIEKEVSEDNRLKEEIEDLRRLLSN